MTQQEIADQPKANRPKKGRGFAAMDAEKQRQIASMGGKAAHQKGTAHEFSSEEAREAGRKGGVARSNSNRKRAMEASGAAGPSIPTTLQTLTNRLPTRKQDG